MKEITGKELVIRIKGEVQESNLADFEETALEVLGSINRELKTDEDFVVAKKNIKDCKLLESRIHKARQSALTSTASIKDLIDVTKGLEEKVSQTRLELDKLVKTEEVKRKTEILDAGREKLDGWLKMSPIFTLYHYDNNLLSDAIKGRRLITKIQESVDEVVELEIEIMLGIETNYTNNLAKITAIEEEYPGLFPEKKQLAMEELGIVDSKIESRVDKFKLKVIEKKQREDVAAKKIEDDAKKKAEAERVKEVVVPEPTETHVPLMHTTPPPPPETLFEPLEDIPLPPAPPTQQEFVCTFYVKAEKDCDLQVIKKIMELHPGVLGVEIGAVN